MNERVNRVKDRDWVVLVIPVKDNPYNAVWTLPGEPGSPENYRALVGHIEQVVGYPVEHVTVFCDFTGGRTFRYLDMFVNEEGHLLGLPINAFATAIYQNNTIYHDPQIRQEDIPTIAGPAVLFEEKVWR